MSAASSSMPFFGTTTREENQNQMLQQSTSTPASSMAPTTAPPKKRRNQPGTPNPDAEVIALSPKTLMATNRFICEVCNKGFQREQNLQLHRRGHNLPWKLKQKTNKEPKRKVYLCPEPTCVHHDPSRALGDLTGIKKHYSRKHGEKKWKCEKCSKRYAVQSDWKAHSKTCGTREYRCDCGTLFSRRDSFITHRAFCDALAQESARHPTSLNTIGGHIYGNNHMNLGLSQIGSQIPSLQNQNHPSNNMLRLGNPGGPKLEHLIPPSNPPYGAPPPPQHLSSSAFFLPDAANQPFQDHQSHHHHGIPFSNKPLQGLMQLPDLQTSSNNSSGGTGPAAANLFNLGFFSNNSNATGSISPDQFNDGTNTGQGGTGLFPNNMGDHMGSGMSSLFGNSVQHENIAPHMSATALLQKAAQMGSTTSNESSNLLRTLRASSSNRAAAAAAAAKSDRQVMSPNSIQNIGGVENENHLQGLMNSLANGPSAASMFGGGQRQDNSFGGFGGGGGGVDEAKLHQNLAASFGGSDKLTLDFLGVGGIVRNMGGGYSQRDLQQQQQQHGMTSMTSLDPQLKSTQGSQPFRGTALQ